MALYRKTYQTEKAIYKRYKESLKDILKILNPFEEKSAPNYWLSYLLTNGEAMCLQIREERKYLYKGESGKNCSMEILDALTAFNAEED